MIRMKIVFLIVFLFSSVFFFDTTEFSRIDLFKVDRSRTDEDDLFDSERDVRHE